MTADETVNGIKVVNAPTRDVLNDRQLTDYIDYKTRLVRWLLAFGKNPDRADGYAQATVRQVASLPHL